MQHLFTGDLTHRELVAYIRSIPSESALGRAILGDAADWTITTHLLGDVVDLLNVANWQRSGTKKRAPKPIKRPKPPIEIAAGPPVEAPVATGNGSGPPPLRDRIAHMETEVSDADDDPEPRGQPDRGR